MPHAEVAVYRMDEMSHRSHEVVQASRVPPDPRSWRVPPMSVRHLAEAVARPRPGSAARHSRRSGLGIGLVVATFTLAACGGGGGGGGGGGDAEGYPDGDITFVVPFSAGGPTDTVTRLIAEPMSEELGASIVVQNVEGAGGTIAACEVAAANPDGYTVLMHHIGMSTAPSLYPDLAYDPLEDFKTIGLVTEVPVTILARQDLDAVTIEELVVCVTESVDTGEPAEADVE